jgi:hypothetical protein
VDADRIRYSKGHETDVAFSVMGTIKGFLRQGDAARVDRDAWRDLARKEGDERRELAQRLALTAAIAASGPTPAPATPAPEPPRRSWAFWRKAG